jgi:LmbE family N-acetylglucosaminyl deacetylase
MSSDVGTRIKARLRPFVRGAARLVEHGFVATAAIAGRVGRPAVTDWSSPGRHRVLVVAPHPDDESIGCAGTILRHLAAGDETTILYVTDGSSSRAIGLGADEMRRRRREEARAACRVLGVERVRWMGLGQGDWRTDDLVSALVDVLDESPPDVIYAPSRVDFHPDHQRVAFAVALALYQHGSRVPTVRAYQIQVPLTRVLVNLVADVSVHSSRIRQTLSQYVTQQATIATTIRLRRYQAAYYGRGEVEVFWETDGDRFSRLHLAPPSSCRAGAVRGVRPRPFSDPLAFWSGRAERWACRRGNGHGDRSG